MSVPRLPPQEIELPPPSTARPLVAAEACIADLGRKNPHALELATLASAAARIEPELLRALRLALVPGADSSAEADLWLSPAMSSRSVIFATMRPDVAALLRERLAQDRERLDAARRGIQRVHRDAPPAIRAEEEITWRALADRNCSARPAKSRKSWPCRNQRPSNYTRLPSLAFALRSCRSRRPKS